MIFRAAAITGKIALDESPTVKALQNVEKMTCGGTETARTKRFITVVAQLTGADLLKVVQTSSARLACLAF